jgi:hypothetical protein
MAKAFFQRQKNTAVVGGVFVKYAFRYCESNFTPCGTNAFAQGT